MKYTSQSVFCPCFEVQGHLYRENALKRFFSGQSKWNWNISAIPNVTTAPPVSNLERYTLILLLLSRRIIDQLIKVLLRHLWNKVVYCCLHYIALLHPKLGRMHAFRIPNPHVVF